MTRPWTVRRNGLLLVRKLTKAGAEKIAGRYPGALVAWEPMEGE